jgi:WD40 repeat protein
VKFAEKNSNQPPNHFKYSLKHDFPVVHGHWITCCACTPDQKYIFTVSNDRTMKQWSTQLLTLFLDWGVIHDGFVYQIKITPSGSHA